MPQPDQQSNVDAFAASSFVWLYLLLIPLWFVVVFVFRRETPIVNTRNDCYPHRYLLPYVHTLRRFTPSCVLFNRHLETFVPLLLHEKRLPFKLTKEQIPVKALEKYLLPGICVVQCTPVPETVNTVPELCPVVIICPGLTGGLRAPYVQRIVRHIWSQGWQAMIFNPRYV